MKIELTSDEVDTLDRALLVWEREPQGPNHFTAMMHKVMAPDEEQLAFIEKQIAQEEVRVNAERDRRRRTAAFIRAKLFHGQKFGKSHHLANPADAMD